MIWEQNQEKSYLQGWRMARACGAFKQSVMERLPKDPADENLHRI